MIFLLDVNVLVALMDQDHAFNERAHTWFADQGHSGWATCPMTENGVLRILGHVRYPNGPGTPAAVAVMLQRLRKLHGHEFWPDEISLLAARHVRLDLIGTAGKVSDTYLLALAVQRRGKLATFDRRLSDISVEGGAEALHLIA